jgi:hypothetical protein
MISNVICAEGAYGRKAKWEDYNGGKDFRIFEGPWFGAYFSVRDESRLRKDGIWEIRFYDSIHGLQHDEPAFIVDLRQPD